MRGRMTIFASRWIGRPSSESSMVTRAPPSSPTGSTAVTSPTWTPAMRTGEPGLTLFAVSNTAENSKRLAKGLACV
jgi:hypothetical protein